MREKKAVLLWKDFCIRVVVVNLFNILSSWRPSTHKHIRVNQVGKFTLLFGASKVKGKVPLTSTQYLGLYCEQEASWENGLSKASLKINSFHR